MGLSSDLYASTFYAITGFHGLHVLVGLLILLGLATRGRRTWKTSGLSGCGNGNGSLGR
jgi:cytochrome c oxidase subunit 3